MERYKKINKGFNTKMRKRNKKRISCVIKNLWDSPQAMKEDIFIDLEKQQVINLSTGNFLTPFLREHNLPIKKRRYYIKYKEKILSLHRLFFYWHNGYLPKLVDHKDRNPQNNNIENLRELDSSGNTRNSDKINKKTSSKYKGVSWNKEKKKWVANVYINYKNIYIGAYISEDDAGQAYNNKIRELGLEGVSVMNDTPQERARKNNLFEFEPLPPEMNHLKDLFLNIEPLVDFK